MCIATVYVETGAQREEVMRDVILVQAENSGFLLVTLLGEEKFLEGRLKSIDFLKEHSVVFEK
jgi:predicted RNA-binding protein